MNGKISHLSECDIIFVCLSAPINEEGQDTIEIGQTLEELHYMGFTGVVVVRSNLLPGTMLALQSAFASLRLVHSPDLTLKDQNRVESVLLSGTTEDMSEAYEIFERLVLSDQYHFTDTYAVTEWAGYIHSAMCSSSFATFMELRGLCQEHELFDEALRALKPFNIAPKAQILEPRKATRDLLALEYMAEFQGYKLISFDGIRKVLKKLIP